jgi:hypothetical protein
MDWHVMRIAILTSLFGDRDILHPPEIPFEGIDYYAFVDKPRNTSTWKEIVAPKFTVDEIYNNRRNAKIYKIMSPIILSTYDYYIWRDVTHEVIEDPRLIIENYMQDAEVACFPHTTRNCAYKEGQEILRLNYDNPENVIRQLEFYASDGFPAEQGLWEMSAFIFKNTFQVKKLSMMWWEQICKYSSRDQISFPYCLWKCGITPVVLPGYANGYNIHTGKIGNNPIIPQRYSHIY